MSGVRIMERKMKEEYFCDLFLKLSDCSCEFMVVWRV